MLRLILLALYLAGWFSPYPHLKGGGLDPNGFSAPVPPLADIGGGLDPNG